MSAIIDFIANNIVVILTVLAVLFGSVRSSKKRQQREETRPEEMPEFQDDRDDEEDSEIPSLWDLFKEVKDEEPSSKPWNREEPAGEPRPRSFREAATKGAELVREAKAGKPVLTNIPSEIEVPPLRPATIAKIEEAGEAVEERIRVIKRRRNDNLSGDDLVKAVVMAEVLDKPKALRQE